MLRAECSAEPAVKVGGNGAAGSGAARGGGVTVDGDRVLLGQQAAKLPLHRFGRRNIGIADTEVKDVFRADLGLSFVAVFKQLPYDRTVCSQGFHPFFLHCGTSRYSMVNNVNHKKYNIIIPFTAKKSRVGSGCKQKKDVIY